MQGITDVRVLTDLPLVAIGGIDTTNAADAIRAGADGIAVVSAVMAANDPKASASTLGDLVDRARAGPRKGPDEQRASA
jgi:thiamine-phosphate pyrophosphorylase